MDATTELDARSFDEIDPEPISLHHFAKTIRAYRVVIAVVLAGTAVAFAVAALAVYLYLPSKRVTTQPFRLDFQGAATGRFPNGLHFSTRDILSPSILLQVYGTNELSRYVTYPDFSRSVFVLESNAAYEVLAAEYQARLADPKLYPVDRDRVLKEYEQKRDAIAKNEYALSLLRFERLERMPETIVRKSLADILSAWSEYALKDQDVLAYPVAVLSPQVLAPSAIEATDPVIATTMLRTRTLSILDNIQELQKLPGADLARSGPTHTSLEEVRLRIEEIERYRIEPLVSRAIASGAGARSVSFLQDQLDYDKRQLTLAKGKADALRDSLAAYEQGAATGPVNETSTAATQERKRADVGPTVMPQLSDTFVDRVVDLVGKSADAQYRQKIVDDYRKALQAIAPLDQAVGYDTRLLDQIKRGGSGSGAIDFRSEIDSIRLELVGLVRQMNDIYRDISRNVYSTSQLITMTAPPSTRVERAISLPRLALWGVLVMLIALPVTVIGCMLHSRAREEEFLEIQASRERHFEHVT